MGLLWMPAGQKNREKSLDKPFSVNDILKLIPQKYAGDLKKHFNNSPVYIWGSTNHMYKRAIAKVKLGEYVVDLKKDKIINVFQFCFPIENRDYKLQESIDWETAKGTEGDNKYPYVYFLRNPQKPSEEKSSKQYYQRAFQKTAPHWCDNTFYFDDEKIDSAMKVVGASDIEEFLGITSNDKSGGQQFEFSNPPIITKPSKPSSASRSDVCLPEEFKPLPRRITILKKEKTHERAHESLVEDFFEKLGFTKDTDIKFRSGRVDISLFDGKDILLVIEVKRKWNLDVSKHRSQAFNYASEQGARFVIITNGDDYVVFDRQKGNKYDDQLIHEFKLTNIDASGIEAIEFLRKQNLVKFK